MSEKALIIAYLFPPIGGAGVQRIVKFAKYLPGCGWEPVVLTVDKGLHISYDQSLALDLPETIPVYRSRMFDPEDIRGWWRSRNEKTPSHPISEPYESHPEIPSGPSSPPCVSSRLKGALAHLYLRAIPWFFVPDRKVGWLPYAARLGNSICGEHSISALFSTSGFGIPWVADFRDLWIQFPGHKAVTPVHSRLEKRIEYRIVHGADRIIANTEVARQVLIKDYPSVDPDHIITIPNGYDEEDFIDLPAVRPDMKFTLTYTGNFYGNRNPQTLFQAVERLCKEQPSVRDNMVLRFIGPPSPRLTNWIRKYDLADMVEVKAYMPHRQSIEALAESDVLLLIDAPEFNANIPGKVFEYLRVNRPILALVPQGATTDLLAETGGAAIVHPNDIDGIARTLMTLFESRDDGSHGLKSDASVVARYERRQLTEQLTDVFNGISI